MSTRKQMTDEQKLAFKERMSKYREEAKINKANIAGIQPQDNQLNDTIQPKKRTKKPDQFFSMSVEQNFTKTQLKEMLSSLNAKSKQARLQKVN